MDNSIIDRICIDINSSILDALKQMDRIGRKLLVVCDGSFFYSLLSIGDIQRSIIANIDLSSKIAIILRKTIKVATIHDNLDVIKRSMQVNRNEFMPVVDDRNNIIKIIFWEDLFVENRASSSKKFNLPIVIMAGGKGTRLRPLTNILPKPLIPINEKTIVEDIMDRFENYGSSNFYMSVNYKYEIIKMYFDALSSKKYNINFFKEDMPLGTAGSLHLIKNEIDTTFFVTNCDILIDDDYNEILRYHFENKNEITCVAAIKHMKMPYGTFQTENNGILRSIKEKPEYSFKINTGLYVIEPHLLNEIPENKYYHITYLIEKLCNEKRNVGVYPISEGSWVDIGNWDEYIKYISK